MIGKNSLIIDMQEIATRGMSSSDNISDGAFSPETDAVNLIANPGVLYAPALPVDKSTNLTGSAIAWCPTSTSSINGFILAGDGKIMSIDSNQDLTASTALAGTFTTGSADIIAFNGKIFATSSTDVARMDTNLTNGNATWWSATATGAGAPFGILTAGVRHPLVVFQDLLWVGDDDDLHKITSSAAGSKNFLSLGNASITALGVDPSSGLMLIGATQGTSYGGTISSGNSIFTYNGTSASYNREYKVDGQVTAFRDVGGVVYVAYGQNLGYWNGAGVTFLRKLKNVTLVGAQLPYKHHLTNILNTLYVIDGKQILAYGEVLPGQKRFYYCQSNNINTNKYTLIAPVGDNKLGLGFDTAKFYTVSVTSIASTGTMVFFTNKYNFPRPVYLRSVYLEYSDALPNNDNNRNLYYKNQDQQAEFQTLIKEGQTSSTALKNETGESVYFQENIISFVDNKVRSVQFRYNTTGTNIGLRRIIVYYDVAE